MDRKFTHTYFYATLLVLLLVIGGVFLLYTALGIDQHNIGTQNEMEISKREELQRYLGYEDLLPRYLTLPFDVSIGNNQIGAFVDVGFILFLFLPLLFLYIIRKNKWQVLIYILGLLLYLFVSISNSMVVDGVKQVRVDTLDKLEAYHSNYSFCDAPVDYTMATLYLTCRKIYNQTLRGVVETISGNQDYITYPILLFLFIGLCLMAYVYSDRRSKLMSIMIIITTIYSFYWITLSSGIIWYGYLLLVLGFILTVYGINFLRAREDSFAKFLTKSFYSIATLWIVVGFVAKVSNITLGEDKRMHGMTMVYSGTYKYMMGIQKDPDKVMDDFYPYVSGVFKRMNQDRSTLIYKVGTSMTFFLKNNEKRVFSDNQLGIFSLLQKRFKTPDQLTDAFKAFNVKFILVDLNTATLDNTPEQTLVKKYSALSEYLFNNPRLRLIGTDRQVKRHNDQGELKIYRHMFGQELVTRGSYAVFEIM